MGFDYRYLTRFCYNKIRFIAQDNSLVGSLCPFIWVPSGDCSILLPLSVMRTPERRVPHSHSPTVVCLRLFDTLQCVNIQFHRDTDETQSVLLTTL